MVRKGAFALVWVLVVVAPPASAQAADETLTRRPIPPRTSLAERLLQGATDPVNASDALDEMIDEVAADMARLGAARISPMVIERVEVSQNIDPRFASILEARLVAAVFRGAGVSVVRCPECRATRGAVEDGAWVVRRGITSREELIALAQDGTRAVMRAWFTLRESPDSLALDVEVARTDDASIVFAEGYRIDPATAMLYRGAETAQSRAERLKDLEDRIERRPRFGQAVLFGAMVIPDKVLKPEIEDKGPILGAVGTYRIYETFGPAREFKVGLNMGGFIHTTRLAGGLLSASVTGRLTGASIYGPDFSIGLAGGGFITGQGGNTPFGSLLAELILAHRLAIQASVTWVHPFELGTKKEHEIGGIAPQAGMGFVW